VYIALNLVSSSAAFRRPVSTEDPSLQQSPCATASPAFSKATGKRPARDCSGCGVARLAALTLPVPNAIRPFNRYLFSEINLRLRDLLQSFFIPLYVSLDACRMMSPPWGSLVYYYRVQPSTPCC
jgi:hypothetical protein